MNCFLFIPENELDDQISLNICRSLRKISLAKVYFFHPFQEVNFQNKGYPEIKSKITLPSVCRFFPKIVNWYRFIRTLRRRRRFRETVVLVGRKTYFLFWIFFLTHKKPVFILVTSQLKQAFSWFDRCFTRYFAQSLLTNDQHLNHFLRQKNQASYFMGNILTDLVQPIEFPFIHGKKTIYSIFPSTTRFEFDFEIILKIFPDFADMMNCYYLMVIPPSQKTLQKIATIGNQLGWNLSKSLEGEILEGYLWKTPYYMNLTLFRNETLVQSDFIISMDDMYTIQAVGLNKKVIPFDRNHPQEIFAYLKDTNYLNEFNKFLKSRFGTSGTKERIAAYLLRGIVDDKRFLKNYSTPD